MSNSEHRRVAKLVLDAVASLNAALGAAYQLGLHVEINDSVQYSEIDKRGSRRMYSATVEMREPIDPATQEPKS